MEADFGNQVHDLFAVKLEDDAQDAVRARMLRPHVQEDEFAGLGTALHPPLFRAKAQRFLLALFDMVRHREGPHFRGARWMLFPQAMASVAPSGEKAREWLPWMAARPPTSLHRIAANWFPPAASHRYIAWFVRSALPDARRFPRG